LFGDYELLGEVARGGMGVVFKARQRSLDRVVALKMILAGQLAGEADVQRFRQEAQMAGRLQHPGIVALHEVGEHEGQHFFSMDFIEGESLGELVREHPLPPDKAVRYVRLVAEAVQFAHEHGVLHRDLKPGNVLIDRFDQPRVTDFGLAKNIQKDAGLTDTGAVLGTPSYMPPEQASGQRGKVGPASDVYALGAVLYELVTGRPPFRAATPLDTLFQVLSEEPAPPRLLNPAISRDLETVILKCLHKEPERRYASAAELGEDLGALLEVRPIKARPASLPERVGIWLKRQGRAFRVVVATAGVAALVLLVVLLVLDWRHHARMGSLELSTNGQALRAEVFAEDGVTLVVPPLTAPTQEPLRLPEGNYRVRLSAPQHLGETISLFVKRGTTTARRVDLSERVLGAPLPSTGVFEFVPRGKGHDVLTATSADTLSRYDGATGKQRWTVTLGPDNRPTKAKSADEEKRSYFFSSPWPAAGGPRLLGRWRSPDGEGMEYLVWVNFAGSALLALSGTDGKFLWDFRASKIRACFAADDQGPPLVLALVSGPTGQWAEALDARTGRSVWPSPYRLKSAELGDPQVVNVDGRPVLVFVAGSRLIGLGPRTGKLAWPPVEQGLVPFGAPAFADLNGDGRLDMVFRGRLDEVFHHPEKRPSPRPGGTVRAVTVPTGEVLWEHKLPENRTDSTEHGWLPTHELGGARTSTETGILRGPLPIDLNGDGKAEVIVPHERGTIAVLDGSSGQVRWASQPVSHWGRPSVAGVLVGPDLDGDGWRDLFVVNMVLGVKLPRRVEYTSEDALIRVQALSGATGKPLWRCRFPLPGAALEVERVWGTPLLTWQRGQDGWPMLVVPGARYTLVLEAGSGQLAHVIPDLAGPYRAIDLDGDGAPELIGYQGGRDAPFRLHGRLHRFRGVALETGQGQPVTPREELVDRVPLLWVQKARSGDGSGELAFAASAALVFFTYSSWRVLRKGWRGLWLPVSAYLVITVGVGTLSVVLNPPREPWQRYSWDGWYWVLFFGLLDTSFLLLGGLALLGLLRLLRRLFRRVFRRRAGVAGA
jgi:tRNA A-37 threonylcarbamoyl transferase component Bud32/outer membrane protein assembly factor BamB